MYLLYLGHKNYDPGQVPNGAKCADNSMCINSKCVSITPSPESCQCNGHGICNQKDQCHCDVGWAPPLCEKKGTGGSIPIPINPSVKVKTAEVNSNMHLITSK